MLQELDGKVAVITGGGSGIGASLAEACAAEGMRVVVADVNGERAEAVASELPDDTAYGKAVDVSDAAQVQGMLGHWQEALTHIGFLDPAAPKKLMPRLNQLFNRAQLTQEEIHILRGVAKAMLQSQPPTR